MTAQILKNLSIEALNAMQTESIEAFSNHADVLLLSPTGSGKTLAFLLPLLERLDSNKEGVQALILAPSRELALQIESVFKQMKTSFKVNCCYGGHSTKVEKLNFSNPPALLIGTPGRINYHLIRKNFDTGNLHSLVIDEFDKSLEFGFHNEMKEIFQAIQPLEKKMLTSATILEKIPDFLRIHSPKTLDFLEGKLESSSILSVKYLQANDNDKLNLLLNLICFLGEKHGLIFCNHREAVDRISELLKINGIEHGVFHGGLEQVDRERELIKFRNGSLRLLITTDLASRGLDIPEIEAIIHYQLPPSSETFIHRNGRTARMNANGNAFLLLTKEDHLPSYLTSPPERLELPNSSQFPPKPKWSTLYIGGGKKEKINKVDIVGALIQKGKLQKDEIGLIEVLDHFSYAAVSSEKLQATIQIMRREGIKSKKLKIDRSK